MPEKLLELVAPDVLKLAAENAARQRVAHFLSRHLESGALLDGQVRQLMDSGLLNALEDGPSLRAWMWSVGRLGQALRAGAASIPVDVLDHLRVDASHALRVQELLHWQLLGIVFGQAMCRGDALLIEVPLLAPERWVLDGIGVIELDVPPASSPCILQLTPQELLVRMPTTEFRVRADVRDSSVHHRFDAFESVVAGCHLAYRHDSLCRPFFQPLPLLVGRLENQRFVAQLRRCWSALVSGGQPGVSDLLSWCRSVIGLVSLSESIGSASREEAMGLVFLPAGTDDMNLAECLLHEALHQYLFRVEEAAELFADAHSKTSDFYSPWRTDGRPLRMVLHGAFVFAGVAALHLRWIDQPNGSLKGSMQAAAQRVAESEFALRTVQNYASLTAVGQKVVRAVARQLEMCRQAIDPALLATFQLAAKRRAHEFPTLRY